MQRLGAHLGAIGLALVILLGVLSLPAIGSLTLPSLFTAGWLLFAVLALLAQMRQAKLVGSKQQRVPEQQALPLKRRGR